MITEYAIRQHTPFSFPIIFFFNLILLNFFAIVNLAFYVIPLLIDLIISTLTFFLIFILKARFNHAYSFFSLGFALSF